MLNKLRLAFCFKKNISQEVFKCYILQAANLSKAVPCGSLLAGMGGRVQHEMLGF